MAVFFSGVQSSFGTVIFSDNFNIGGTGSSSDMNAGLGQGQTRQSGTLAPATYSEYFSITRSGKNGITSNQFSVGKILGIYNHANLLSSLTAASITGFTVSFDAANTGDNWISLFLTTHSNGKDPRKVSEFGILIGGSNTTIHMYGGTGSRQVPHGTITSKVKNPSGTGAFTTADMNHYELVATQSRTNPARGTYNLIINGVTVQSNIAYDLGSGATVGSDKGLFIAVRTFTNPKGSSTGGVGTFDNLSITTTSAAPKPASPEAS